MPKAHGVEDVADDFDRIAKRAPIVMRQAGRESLLMLHQNTPRYPSPPQGSTYRRTLQLGRSITTLRGVGGAPGALSNIQTLGATRIKGVWGTNIKYAGVVIDKGNQAPVHQGRWYTLQDVFDKNIEKLFLVFNKHFDRMFKR